MNKPRGTKYRGPVRAVIFDWAGTVVDHGCMAPIEAFVQLFAERGVTVTPAEARGPMGVHKREHIRQMLALPRIASAWREACGAKPTDADVDALYERATPVQVGLLATHADPIPGILELVTALEARDIRVGTTTGYNRQMLDTVKAAAAARGFAPKVAIPSSEVPEGRPAPYLCWAALAQLGVWPAAAALKVGDTIVDVQAGLNAGLWSIGVARTGNLVGRPLAAMSDPGTDDLVAAARQTLRDAGAHYVIDGPEGLLEVIDDIDRRLAAGERP